MAVAGRAGSGSGGSGQWASSGSGKQSKTGERRGGETDSNFPNPEIIESILFVMRNSVLIVLATLAVAAAQKGQGADGNPHGKRP